MRVLSIEEAALALWTMRHARQVPAGRGWCLPCPYGGHAEPTSEEIEVLEARLAQGERRAARQR